MTMTVFLVVLLIFGPVFSSSAELVKNAHVEVELISETESIQPGIPFWVALRMKMDEGWHTYWNNPGDSGLPTMMRWFLPDGFEPGPIQWPYPEIFTQSELFSYGYTDEVFLFTKIDVPESVEIGSSQTIQMQARWLSCEKVCIPGRANLTLEIPVAQEEPKKSYYGKRFSQERLKLPHKNSAWKISAEGYNKNLSIHLVPPSTQTGDFSSFYFFPYRNDVIDHGEKQKYQHEDDGYTLLVQRSSIAPQGLRTLSGIVVFERDINGVPTKEALEIDAPISIVK